jgi:23S rRNA pseudouridine1911/1915/1917 synthase
MDEQFFTFEFDQELAQRLDKFLVVCLPDLSRSRIQALIKDGKITIDDDLPRKSGQMLEKGSKIQIHIPATAPTDLIPEAIPLEIIFENDELIVVNKPAGMVVHPAAGHSTGTLHRKWKASGGNSAPGLSTVWIKIPLA